MTDAMQGLVSEAKKNKFSIIGQDLTDEDVVSVWESVSAFIEKHMSQQKGVNIPGLGTFTYSQKKLDVGNNKFILIQRPVFLTSEKFAQTHGLHHTKHHTTGQIPVVQLNYAALSFETPFDRDTVESCVKEVLQAMNRSLSAKKNIEFTFNGIGRLSIRDNKVKMKFFKEFINSMDGSGRLLETLKDRPGTMDSVMSDRPPSRPNTSNTLVLPRIAQPFSLAPEVEGLRRMPAIVEEVVETETGLGDCVEDAPMENENKEFGDLDFLEIDDKENDDAVEKPASVASLPMQRSASRVAAPIAKATGVMFEEDMVPPEPSPGLRVVSALSSKTSPTPIMMKRSLSPINSPTGSLARLHTAEEFVRSKSVDHVTFKRTPLPGPKVPTPPGERRPSTGCGHSNSGQELCYLCHQRSRRNIPVSFAEERRRREQEEDKLLQQYQHMKDSECIYTEQEQLLGKRHGNQKMAAFNLGVAEAIKTKKHARDVDFHPSYIFQKRPLTPPRFIKQEQYYTDLADQVLVKSDSGKKRRSDEEFLERLEQVQLAEDLAVQREQYLREKADQQELYKRALSAQLRYKPQPIPSRVSDSHEPVFGKSDMNNDKMADRRRRAHELYKDQLQTVEQRKRDAILKRLQEQKDEEDMLKRTKHEMIYDRADRYECRFQNRKKLEEDWTNAVVTKKHGESEEVARTYSPGMLLHEQCDRYRRCGQCKRTVNNCGESNIWSESRYIPGSRLMV